MPFNHLILCRPLLLSLSIFPSIRVFSNKSALHIRWPKYWSFSFSISPTSEHSGLISVRMDWSDFLAVQGTLKSLLQHHSSKASILWCSAFFIVQLSYSNLISVLTIWLCPCVESSLVLLEEGVCYDQCVLLAKLLLAFDLLVLYSRPNLPVTPGVSWFPTFAFQSAIMKRISFWV